MLDQYFGREALPLLDQGPLAPYLKGFCRQLHDQGYARWTIRRYVAQASHFSRYLQSLRGRRAGEKEKGGGEGDGVFLFGR